jgi:lipoate-protein ligase A
LVVGRGQSLSDIDEDVCRKEGILVVRRKTGGTAVLHNPSVNVALVLPSGHAWASSIRGLYSRFVSAVSAALRQINIAALPLDVVSAPRPEKSPICFEADSGETLVLNKRKVFGCAQHRTRDAVLVHGTLLLGLDVPQHSRVFKVPEDRIARSLSAVPSEYDPGAIEDALIIMISTELAMTPVRIGAQYDG